MSMQHAPRQIVVERKSERTPHKPKPWGHQQELQRLRGRHLRIEMMDRGPVIGKLVEVDQFTLKLQLRDQSNVTYFKHAILSYGLTEPA